MSHSCFIPLDKGDVRLLSFADLIPPTKDDPMPLSLAVFKLREAPPYTALSYEWGPPSESKSILLNETRIPIRDNLFAFLQRYRESGQGGYLWIDVLCINQSDVTERGHQVGIMGDIYKNAFRVIAWLGSGPPKLVEAFRELAEVVRRFPILHLPFGASFELPEQSRLEEDQISAFRVLSSSNSVAQSVSEVGQSTYWTRLWIIQEFVLAKDAEIWCGRAGVHYRALHILFGIAWGHFPLPLLEDQEKWFSIQMQAKNRSQQIQQMWRVMVWRWQFLLPVLAPMHGSLDYLLCGSWEAHCADVRDRVYGLLGLMDEEYLKRFPIIPDYEISASRLYLELCLNKMRLLKARDARRLHGLDVWKFCKILQYALRLAPDDEIVLLVSAMVVLSLS